MSCSQTIQKHDFLIRNNTLESGINIGPTFINFGFISRPYSLIKGSTLIKFLKCFPWPTNNFLINFFIYHKFAYFRVFFCQIFHALRLLKAIRLLFLSNFPGPTFILCPGSIPDSRVVANKDLISGSMYLHWIL